jgi:large subunit ribosomal protein L25
MAKQQKLTAQTRVNTGRSAVIAIKKQGLVPAVVYGGQDKPIALSVNAREIGNILAHATSEHFLVDLEIADGGSTTNRLALVQEVQHDPIRGNVLHVDFHAVKADEKLHAEIPVVTVGEPNGVKNYGGILEISVHAIEVECLPKDLPELITLDVSALNVGEGIHVKDIKFPEGVTSRLDGELTIVRVAAPTVEAEPAAGAVAAAGPEVIKEKKEEGAAAAPAKGAAPAKPADKK